MPNKKTIAQLFEESIERGLDTYEHVAKEIWGTVNVTTRRLAKEICFGIMYGQREGREPRSVSDSELAKLRDVGHRWRMTEEEIEEKLKQPIEIKSEYMCEPPNIPKYDEDSEQIPKADRPTFGELYGARLPLPESSVFTDGGWKPGEMRQSEDRMHRKGISTYVVEVFDDSGCEGKKYTIRADSALSARCMAFVIDGGFATGATNWDDGHIELALTYTVIL
jgi:hypothetical protein